MYIDVDSVHDSCDNKTVKKLPLISKNLNRAIEYLTFKARLVFM